MNNANFHNHDDRLDSPLRKAVEAVRAESVTAEAAEQAIGRVLRLQAAPARPSHPGRSITSWRAWRAWFIPGVAAVIVCVAVVILWNRSTQTLLADEIVEAISDKPWMHAVGKGSRGIDVEMWYSPSNGIVASQYGEHILFLDSSRGTMDIFEKGDAPVPEVSRREIDAGLKKTLSEQERMLEALFFGNPAQAFQNGESKLIDHAKKTIQQNGHTFIEHRFTTKSERADQPLLTVLRVDPQTHLPVYWKSTIGDQEVFSGRIEFPEQGPQTIYAMGVPRDVRIVDQTPSDDLKQVLAAWKKGRTRFDNYRAVVVKGDSANDRAGGWIVHQIWRKGLKWRVEQLRYPPGFRDGSPDTVVPPDADPATWWLERGEEWEAMPEAVSDGTREIRLEVIPVKPRRPDPENPDYLLIESYEPHQTNAFGPHGADDPRPYHLWSRPEFLAYPFLLGAESSGYQTDIAPHPNDGPDGTVRIESRDSSPTDRPGGVFGVRYWADPARGYVVEQAIWLQVGIRASSPKGKVALNEMALTPNGFWYPTIVRRFQNTHNLSDGTTSDTYVRFYLDFECEIPDELFDTQAWGAVK